MIIMVSFSYQLQSSFWPSSGLCLNSSFKGSSVSGRRVLIYYCHCYHLLVNVCVYLILFLVICYLLCTEETITIKIYESDVLVFRILLQEKHTFFNEAVLHNLRPDQSLLSSQMMKCWSFALASRLCGLSSVASTWRKESWDLKHWVRSCLFYTPLKSLVSDWPHSPCLETCCHETEMRVRLPCP